MKKYILLLFLLVPLFAWGQASRVDGQVLGPNGQPVHFPLVRVCTDTSNLGSGTVYCGTTSGGLKTLFTDITAQVQCTGSNGCANPITGDYNGNYHFYSAPGKAIVEVIVNGVVQGDTPDTIIPCDPDFNCGTGTGGSSSIPLGSQGQFIQYTGVGDLTNQIGPSNMRDLTGTLTIPDVSNVDFGGPGVGSAQFSMRGLNSGLVVVRVQDAAGNYTLTLPNGPGLANQVLATDGAGNLSFVTPAASAVGAGAAGQVSVYNGPNSVGGDALFTDSGNTLAYTGTTFTLGNATAGVFNTFDGFSISTGTGIKDTISSGTSTSAGLTSGRHLIIQAHAGTSTGFGGDLYLQAVGSTFSGNQSFSPGWVYVLGGVNTGSSGGGIALIPGVGNTTPAYVTIGCNASNGSPCGSPGNPSNPTITGKVAFVGKNGGSVFLTVPDNVGGAVTLTLPTSTGTNGQVICTDGTGVLSFCNQTGGGGSVSGSGTTNTLPKFTAATVLGNSGITDNGTTVNTAENLSVASSTAATGISNVNSPFFQVAGNSWNGASVADVWSFQNVAGAGTNPTQTLTITHSGSSGAASISAAFPFTIAGLTSTGNVNLGGASSVINSTLGNGAPNNATCISTGQEYFQLDGTAGQEKWYCKGNVWTQQLNSGAAGANVQLSNLSGTTAIPVALLPNAAGTLAFGSNALPWTSVFIGGAATNNIQLTGTATSAKVATLPDNTGTIAELNLAQTWTANQTFPVVISSAANPANAGFLRFSSGDALSFRNNANSANVNGLSKDTSDIVQVGDTAGIKLAGPLSSVGAGSALTIRPTLQTVNGTGGDLTVAAGNTSGTGANGNLHLLAGSGGSGTPGAIDIGTSPFAVTLPNDTSNGTLQFNLVSVTSTGNAIQTPAGSNAGVVGIAISGAGTSGSATVVQLGQVNCVFDQAATPGNYVGISVSNNGQCHDIGAVPTINTQAVGTVLSLVSGTTYKVLVDLGSAPGANSNNTVITNPGSTQQIQATAPTAVSLVVKQPTSGSVDIFQVLLANGTKAFYVDSTGVVHFGTGTSSVTSSAFISSAANPAATGVFRAASSDVGLAFRNNANTGDVTIAKNNSDVLTFNGTPGFAVTQAGASFGDTVSFTTPAANRTITFADPGGNDSVAYLAATQTFTGKTIGTGGLLFATQTAPGNPAGGNILLYADSGTGNLACLTSAGANCLPSAGGGGTVALSAITAATSTPAAINNANFPQKWNWQLTTNGTSGFTFGEFAASTATSSNLVNIKTLASSTLNPLTITALGNVNGLQVNNIGDLTFLGTGMLDTGTSSQTGSECANEGVTGTTNGLVAKLNTSNQCIKATTSDVAGVEGIVVKGGGTSGNAVIATSGVVSCTFSNTAVVGDYVGVSTTTGGDCLDLGSQPTAGTQVLGRALTAGAGSQSVLVYGRGMLAITGVPNRVTTAFAGGVLTLSLPQDIATTSIVQFGGVKSGTSGISGSSGTNSYDVRCGIDGTASQVCVLTVRGADFSGTGNNNGGAFVARGGNTGSNGSGVAGNADFQAGQDTGSGGNNGHIQIDGAYVKGATYTTGNTQCFTADNTVQDCGTSAVNFVGVAVSSNGSSAIVALSGTQVLVNYDATVSPSAGWFACSSASVAGKATAQSGACSAGRTIGVIEKGGTNVTSGNVTLAHF